MNKTQTMSFVKERGGWLLILILSFGISQLPILLSIWLANQNLAYLWSGLAVGALSILVLSAFIFFSRKAGLASFRLSFFKGKDLARIILSYLVVFTINLLGSAWLRYSQQATTENQAIVNEIVFNSSLISSFFLIVLIAPICEEIICRGIIPQKLFRGREGLGYVMGGLVFTLLHMPSNLPSFVIYGGMSTVLTWTAYKTKRLEMSILLHMLINGISYLLLALVVLLGRHFGVM